MNSSEINQDHLIPVTIEDTVQCLKFFPSDKINYLASGGWDGFLRIFEINYQIIGQNSTLDKVKIDSSQKFTCHHQSPILSLAWKGDSGAVITGNVDGSLNYVDCQKQIFTKIGGHQDGCKEVLYLPNYDLILSGGWDCMVKLWDLRSNNPVTSYQFFNKIYSMSFAKNLLVGSLSENVMTYFNLDNIQKGKFQPELIYSSQIKSHIRKVLVLNEGNCYLEGSAEGRIAVKFVNLYAKPTFTSENDYNIHTERDYSFKSHREVKDKGNEKIVQAYAINDMSVNPVYGSVVSVGGDGKYTIWDIFEKARINERENVSDKTPLTACDFNPCGNLLAYSSGYDWCKGAKFAHLYPRPKIYIHYLQKSHRKSKNY